MPAGRRDHSSLTVSQKAVRRLFSCLILSDVHGSSAQGSNLTWREVESLWPSYAARSSGWWLNRSRHRLSSEAWQGIIAQQLHPLATPVLLSTGAPIMLVVLPPTNSRSSSRVLQPVLVYFELAVRNRASRI